MTQNEQPKEALTEGKIRFGLRINIVAGSLGMVWVAVVMGIPLTMFLEALGASGVQIGLAVTVQQLAMIVQLPAALFAGRLKTRKPFFVVVCALQRSLWVLPAILPIWLYDRPDLMVVWILGLVTLSSLLLHSAASVWWSWMTDVVPENRRGRFWGRRQSITTAAHLFAVWGAGYLLDLDLGSKTYVGFQIVFLLAAIAGALDILVHLWMPEPAPATPPKTSVRKAIMAPFANPNFRWLTLGMGWWALGVSMVGQYSFLYLRRDFGISYSDLALTSVSASLGVVLFSMIAGYIMDRIGARAFVLVAMVLAPCFGGVWFLMHDGDVLMRVLGISITLAQPVWVLLISNFFAGAVYSAVYMSQVGLLGSATPAEGRTVAMAVHWSCVGVMAAAGPMLAGVLMDYVSAHPIGVVLPMGAPVAFFHMLVVLHALITWILAVPCLFRVVRGSGEVSVRTAATRLFPLNPMRAIGSITDIYTLSSSKNSKHVARAARRVGEKRSAIAVQDLIARVDDPDADVRDEAILALGRLDAPEATDELIRRMNDPEGDSLPLIARALRDARDPRSLHSLVARLSDADRETVTEAARALGEIGDRTAANALLRLLRGSTDSKIVTAASDALSRLDEFAAAYEIVPRMLSAQSPVQRASLAISVADLMGEPGVFYKRCSQERRDRGAALAVLVQELRTRLKRASESSLLESGSVLLHVDALAKACEQGSRQTALQRMADVAAGMSAMRGGRQRALATASPESIQITHVERLGLATWYIGLLQEQGNEALDAESYDVELLLGVYLLSTFDWQRTPSAGGTKCYEIVPSRRGPGDTRAALLRGLWLQGLQYMGQAQAYFRVWAVACISHAWDDTGAKTNQGLCGQFASGEGFRAKFRDQIANHRLCIIAHIKGVFEHGASHQFILAEEFHFKLVSPLFGDHSGPILAKR